MLLHFPPSRKMRKRMLFRFYLLVPVLLIFCFCTESTSEAPPKQAEALFKQYCGMCHQLPNPSHLTQEIWEQSVLPKMAWRLGIIDSTALPYRGLSLEEIEVYKSNDIYSSRPLISDTDWEQVKAYILARAPKEIPFDKSRLNRTQVSRQFIRKDLHVDQLYGANITAIEFDTKNRELWLADLNSKVWHWSKNGPRQYDAASPVVDFHFSESGVLWTEIGKLFPTELKKGSLTLFDEGEKEKLLQGIHRPVFTALEDINGDGNKEMVVCKYGNKVGSLSIYKKKDGTYIEQVLIPVPGAIKCEIKDMNGDGKKDIIALFAQGDEALYILYQQEDFTFKTKKVLRFPAEYGTSDFVLFDYDKDGDLDIATAHGDNADLSYILKPYHGLRLHLNEDNAYKQVFFYPLYGATKIQVEDYDKDGDLDFAVSSFFPDFDQLLEESFVYLENTNSASFTFEAYTVEGSTPIRSLTLEKADFDGDGDIDLIMGLFVSSPQTLPEALDQQWKKAKFDIAVLFNQLQ